MPPIHPVGADTGGVCGVWRLPSKNMLDMVLVSGVVLCKWFPLNAVYIEAVAGLPCVQGGRRSLKGQGLAPQGKAVPGDPKRYHARCASGVAC